MMMRSAAMPSPRQKPQVARDSASPTGKTRLRRRPAPARLGMSPGQRDPGKHARHRAVEHGLAVGERQRRIDGAAQHENAVDPFRQRGRPRKPFLQRQQHRRADRRYGEHSRANAARAIKPAFRAARARRGTTRGRSEARGAEDCRAGRVPRLLCRRRTWNGAATGPERPIPLPYLFASFRAMRGVPSPHRARHMMRRRSGRMLRLWPKWATANTVQRKSDGRARQSSATRPDCLRNPRSRSGRAASSPRRDQRR